MQQQISGEEEGFVDSICRLGESVWPRDVKTDDVDDDDDDEQSATVTTTV